MRLTPLLRLASKASVSRKADDARPRPGVVDSILQRSPSCRENSVTVQARSTCSCRRRRTGCLGWVQAARQRSRDLSPDARLLVHALDAPAPTEGGDEEEASTAARLGVGEWAPRIAREPDPGVVDRPPAAAVVDLHVQLDQLSLLEDSVLDRVGNEFDHHELYARLQFLCQ